MIYEDDFTIEIVPGSTFPIQVEVLDSRDGAIAATFGLTPTEARRLSDFLHESAEEYERLYDDTYVQVRFLPGTAGAQWYTYRDPSGALSVGALVRVPTRYGPAKLAEVVALGRGAWDGPTSEVESVAYFTPVESFQSDVF